MASGNPGRLLGGGAGHGRMHRSGLEAGPGQGSQGSTEEGGAAPPVVLPVVSWSSPPPVSVADGGEGNPLYSEIRNLVV